MTTPAQRAAEKIFTKLNMGGDFEHSPYPVQPTTTIIAAIIEAEYATERSKTYTKPFTLHGKGGAVGTIDIEVYRDAESGEEILTAASLAAITKAKIEQLRTERKECVRVMKMALDTLGPIKKQGAFYRKDSIRAQEVIPLLRELIGKMEG